MDTDARRTTAELLGRLDRKTLAFWAADCAEHVLSCFEERHPDDDRPRKAIETVRAWARGEIKVGAARNAAVAAHAAARAAETPAACAAGRSAGQAAGTAHMAGHAIHAAEYAAKAVALAASPDGAEDAAIREREWQHQRLLEMRG
ncbi:MAG TPA: hypothetical protein VIL27_04110 [Clostridia bacterium]